MLPGMGQRRGRCHAAARGPQPLDLLLVFRKTAHRRAASHDPVGEANARADLIRRALDLDQQDSLAVGEPELGAPKLDCLDRTPIEKLRGGKKSPRSARTFWRSRKTSPGSTIAWRFRRSTSTTRRILAKETTTPPSGAIAPPV